jgi:hypothetical protein
MPHGHTAAEAARSQGLERKSTQRRGRTGGSRSPAKAQQARRKFLRFFRTGFPDQKYIDWERGYKAEAHERWAEVLNQNAYRALLRAGKFEEIAARAVRIESRTNLLFSFEKMALRDAVKSPAGARLFAEGLYDYLYGPGDLEARFSRWRDIVGKLPRRQTRVLTWPVLTVFPFIAQPDRHIFLKPNVTRTAAKNYGFDFSYRSRPEWATYKSLLDFAETVRTDLEEMKPRDMIDLQSFIWVQGSDEYEE